MHLSDNEILEYQKNNNVSNEHLEQCEYCQKRLQNRTDFRQRLDQTFQSSPFEMEWQQLAQEFEKGFPDQQQQKMESKIKKLQFGLISLAACFCLVILAPLFNSNKTVTDIDTKLALAINENYQLQHSVELTTTNGTPQTVAIQALQIKLQQIDSEIQLSYLEGLSKLEKLELWQARRQLLISSIEKLNVDLSRKTESI